MDHSLPAFPPPAYHVSQSPIHSQSNATFDQFLQHIPTPQPQHLTTPSPALTESKWARRSLSSHSNVYIPPPSPSHQSSPFLQESEISESKWARRSTSSLPPSSPWSQHSHSPYDYTESRRNYKNEGRRKFILFVVAILLMLAAMLTIVGATTHFRIRGRGCTTELYNGTWVCI